MGAAARLLYEKLKLPKFPTFSRPNPIQSYRPVESSEDEQPSSSSEKPPIPPQQSTPAVITMLLAGFLALTGVVALTRASYLDMREVSSSASVTNAAAASATVPEYFQTTTEIYAGKLRADLQSLVMAC